MFYNAGSWQLLNRHSNGSYTILNTVGASVVAGHTYHLKLSIRNASKTFYVDGVSVLTNVDNGITGAGKAGMWLDGPKTDTTGVHLDNFKATDVVGSTVFVNDTFTDTYGTTLTAHTGETVLSWTKGAGFTGEGVITSVVRQLIFDGNSLTAGLGSTGGRTYPAQVLSQLPMYDGTNFGVNGQTTTQMASDAASQIDPLVSPANILIAWEIRNEIVVGGATAQQAYDRFVSYCQARRAAGWQVIVLTAVPKPRVTSLGISRRVGRQSTR